MNLETRLQEFLLSDRQWTRDCRISHARANLRRAHDAGDKMEANFWLSVVNANKETAT